MRVGVVGAGVVGLATAASLLRAGAEVVCFERAPVVMGERSAGSSRIFRLAHADPDLVRFAAAARDGFARWSAEAGTPMVDPVGCVVSGGDAAVRAAAMAGAGAAVELADTLPAGRWLPAAGPLPTPVLVDPAGGVVDVDAVRALLTSRAGAVVVHERVNRIDGARVHTPSGVHPFDAVVLAAGAGTAALAAEAGIDLPMALEHHARFTFPLAESPGVRPPAWIDAPADGLPTYQHRTGPGRWAVGGTVDAALVAWENGPDVATKASREVVLEHARARLSVEPTVVESLYCTHAPATGDGIVFRRNGPVLAVWGENLMKFAPVLGEVLAAAAVDGSTPEPPGR